MFFRFVLVFAFVSSFFAFGASIDNLAVINELPRETIKLIIKDHYELYEDLLLEKLALAVLEMAAELQIEQTNSKQIIALFLTYYAVTMHPITGVVATAANNAIYSLQNRRLSSSNTVFALSSKSELAKACEAAFHAVNNPRWSCALHIDSGAGASVIYNVALMVSHALKTIELDPQQTIEMADVSVKLSTLLVLLNLSKPDFLHNYFIRTYEKSLFVLESDLTFDLTMEEALETIAKIARDKEDLKNNNYLKSLQNIFTKKYIRLKSAQERT